LRRPAVMTALVLGSQSSAARADLEVIATGMFDAGMTMGATTLAAPASFTFTSLTFDVAEVGTVSLDPTSDGGSLSNPNTTLNTEPMPAEIINPAAVPEPSTPALVGLGAAGLVGAMRPRPSRAPAA
jgi:hypothetical protein